jgi:hypothetical protein
MKLRFKYVSTSSLVHQKMNKLSDEISIKIFSRVQFPLPLSITDRNWFRISQDPHAKSAWAINRYGKAHVLFHAVRLGTYVWISLTVYLKSQTNWDLIKRPWFHQCQRRPTLVIEPCDNVTLLCTTIINAFRPLRRGLDQLKNRT